MYLNVSVSEYFRNKEHDCAKDDGQWIKCSTSNHDEHENDGVKLASKYNVFLAPVEVVQQYKPFSIRSHL